MVFIVKSTVYIYFQSVSVMIIFWHSEVDIPSSEKVPWVRECYFLEIPSVSTGEVKLSDSPTANLTADDVILSKSGNEPPPSPW